MTLQEMMEKRAGLIAQARGILEKAENESRDATAEERENFDKAIEESNKVKEDIDALQADEQRKSSLENAEEDLKRTSGRMTSQGKPSEKPEKEEVRKFEIHKGVSIELNSERDKKDYRERFASYLKAGEVRGLQAADNSSGGYLTPEEFSARLIKALDNEVWMRQLSSVMTLRNAASLGAPTLDADPSDPVWTTELSTGSNDDTMSFGKREFKPIGLAKRIKLSKTLVRQTPMDVAQLIVDRLAYKFGAAQENAYLNGSGASQPLGIFTASDMGISTSRDISSGNTQTSFSADGLINAKYAIKSQYRNNANWIFHRDAVKTLAKLKDGDGQYLWRQGLAMDEPDNLLNIPIRESEYAPNTFETGNYVGAIGNFNYYNIVDALDMTVQVLSELYAETNQIGYIGRLESDGMPVLEEAFARVTLT